VAIRRIHCSWNQRLVCPRYVPALDGVDAAYETTFVAAIIYIALLVLALVTHRWRGLLLFLALPLILYWPIGFFALEQACRQNVNACP